MTQRIDDVSIKEYIQVRTQRRSTEDLAKLFKKQEDALYASILAQVASGKTHPQVEEVIADKPIVNDWNLVWFYIKETGAYELVHKRLTESAALERIREDGSVPGITIVEMKNLKIKEA